jgi:hypothetical protein
LTIPNAVLKNYAQTLAALRRGKRYNAAQQQLHEAIYTKKKKRVVLVWGRKTGKTEGFIQIALEHTAPLPYRSGYLIGPTRKQQTEILWRNRRIHNAIPADVPHKPLETDFRMMVGVESFLKVDGSEEFASYRGTEYDIMVQDEGQDSDPRFYDASYPNLAARDGLLLTAGTIHSNPQNWFNLKVQDEWMHDPDVEVIFAPTWVNAKNLAGGKGEEWLKREKEKYYKAGDGPQWEREYEARFVFGGRRSVFPTYNLRVRRKPLDVIEAEIQRDRRVLKFIEIADPSQSCFGVLFMAINPYTKYVYVLDEIYERDRSKTSVGSIWTRILEIEAKHKIIEPLRVYDEAAAWFENEMATQIEVGWVPSQKQSKSKEDNISLTKDILEARLLTVNEECSHFDAEMIGYEYDENSVIIKKNDHLVDGFFYGLSVYGYTFQLEAVNVDTEVERASKIEIEQLDSVSINNELVHVEFDEWH